MQRTIRMIVVLGIAVLLVDLGGADDDRHQHQHIRHFVMAVIATRAVMLNVAASASDDRAGYKGEM